MRCASETPEKKEEVFGVTFQIKYVLAAINTRFYFLTSSFQEPKDNVGIKAALAIIGCQHHSTETD